MIGKSVESALLSAVAEDARQAGAQLLTADFVDSGRNAPASGVLAAHGFARADTGRWSVRLGPGVLGWPEHIVREAPSGASAASTAAEGAA